MARLGRSQPVPRRLRRDVAVGAGSVGSAAQTLSLPTNATTGLVGHVGAAAQTLTLPTQATTGLVGHVGAAAQTLTIPTQAAAGKVGHVGTAAQTLALVQQSAEGQAGATNGTAAQTLLLPTQATTGLVGHPGASAQTLGLVTQSTDGQAGSVATDGGSYAPQYAKGERRRRGLEWDRPESIEDRLQRVYDRLHGDLAEVAEPVEVREAVAEHATASDATIPPPAAIDFAGLARDAAAARALLAAYEKALQAKAEADDEEDAIVALLLA